VNVQADKYIYIDIDSRTELEMRSATIELEELNLFTHAHWRLTAPFTLFINPLLPTAFFNFRHT